MIFEKQASSSLLFGIFSNSNRKVFCLEMPLISENILASFYSQERTMKLIFLNTEGNMAKVRSPRGLMDKASVS